MMKKITHNYKRFKWISLFLLIFLTASFFASCKRETPTKPQIEKKIKQTVPSFTFAVFGDNRPSSPYEPQPQVFKNIVEQINQEKVDFVVSTGDMVAGKTNDKEIYRRQYLDFLEIIKNLKAPFYPAAGNHDAESSIGETLYTQLLNKPLYYSFNYKNSHFIVLDTDKVGSEGKIEGEQLKWLEKDLKTHQNATFTFVFMHRPLYSLMNPEANPKKHLSFVDKENENYIKSLMKKYKVDVVFAGHEHFFNYQVKDGVTYVITGCAGAYPYTDEAHGGFYHYTLVEVKGKKIKITVVKATGEKLNPTSIPSPTFP